MKLEILVSLAMVFACTLSAPPAARAEPSQTDLQCAVQSINAEKDGLEVAPGPGEVGNVMLMQQEGSKYFVGTKKFSFPAVAGARARGYAIEIKLRAEPDRSSWINGASRLYLTLFVRDAATNHLLAMHEDHSDKILNQSMVSNLHRSGPRVVFQMLLPDAIAALEAIDAPTVASARARSLEDGFAAAVKSKLLLPREPYRLDVACFPSTK